MMYQATMIDTTTALASVGVIARAALASSIERRRLVRRWREQLSVGADRGGGALGQCDLPPGRQRPHNSMK